MKELIEWLEQQIGLHNELANMNSDNVTGLTEKARVSSLQQTLSKVKELEAQASTQEVEKATQHIMRFTESGGGPKATPYKLLA